MGQLFDRVSRVVRANRNSDEGDCKKIYLNEETALVAGGAVTGASIGRVGILAGGTGYSLGAVPLAAVGALTGAALYEALRSLLENDTSSTSAAAIGAAAGTATSAAIGGVGVAVGGGAIGVGMASMAAGGAVVGLGLVGLNRLLQQGIDPEKLLDSAIEQMQADSRKARQAIANIMASQRRLQQQYEQAQLEIDKWQRRVQLALQKGDEYLAGEALSRKKMHSDILSSLKTQLDQKPTSVNNFKQKLTLLEAKISEAKSMQTRLKAQIAIARVNGQLQGTLGQLGVSSAMAFFERMEERVRQIDARSQAVAELAEVALESQFAMLKPSSDIDEELAVMKAELLGESQQSQLQLPSSKPSNTFPNEAAVNAELEKLKSQLDQL
jgi:phage shock protein A